jgi:hypothetical protein
VDVGAPLRCTFPDICIFDLDPSVDDADYAGAGSYVHFGNLRGKKGKNIFFSPPEPSKLGEKLPAPSDSTLQYRSTERLDMGCRRSFCLRTPVGSFVVGQDPEETSRRNFIKTESRTCESMLIQVRKRLECQTLP